MAIHYIVPSLPTSQLQRVVPNSATPPPTTLPEARDGGVGHVADGLPARIGARVTVGHLAMIHACVVGDECLIGMHATILDGAVIGARSIVGANSLVTKGTQVPPGSLVMGSPAKVVRPLSPAEQAALPGWAEKYVKVAAPHRPFH